MPDRNDRLTNPDALRDELRNHDHDEHDLDTTRKPTDKDVPQEDPPIGEDLRGGPKLRTDP